MKQILFIAGYLILMSACKKEQQPKPPAGGEKKVRIDKFELTQYDNVTMEASVEGFEEGAVQLRGFTWSLSPTRTVGDSLYKVYKDEPFRAHVNAIGQNSKIYMRAFAETLQETYFSDSIVVNTSGLQLLWNHEYSSTNRRVKQVIASGNDGLLLLVERMQGAGSWPGLMQLDTAGNILWDRDYYTNQIKTPQYLLPVADGYLIATSQGFRNEDGIVVFKTDLNGNKLWEKICKQQFNEAFVRMMVLPNQSVQLTTWGYSVVNNKRVNVSINDFFIDANGQVTSTKNIPTNTSFGTVRDPIKALTTSDGGFVSVSETNETLAGGVVANKFNEANQVVWDQLLIRPTADIVHVCLNNAGNYMVRGKHIYNALVMEINKNSGELLWQYDFDIWKYGTAFGEGMMTVGSDGYYIAADSKLYLRPDIHGPLLIKLGANGEFLYEHMYPVSDLHYTDAVMTNANKEIYLFGTRLKNISDRTGKLFVIKLKER